LALIGAHALGIAFTPDPAQAATQLDARTAAAGLKEALSMGTSHAVDLLGNFDGYLGNPEVRIPMPEQLEFLESSLKLLGADDMADEFVTSMNRAAETAAPLAKDVFLDAIREITFDDALRIVRGEKHEATDYLHERAGPRLSDLFEPIVSDQLDSVGATQAFNGLMTRASRNPLIGDLAFDLPEYVTEKALDGMFLMIAKEEEKIREDPLARTTDLLKTVFGGEADKQKVPWWKRVFSSDD
jgi:hypothetical protein